MAPRRGKKGGTTGNRKRQNIKKVAKKAINGKSAGPTTRSSRNKCSRVSAGLPASSYGITTARPELQPSSSSSSYSPFSSPSSSNTNILRGGYLPTERLPQHTIEDLIGMDETINDILEQVIRPFANPQKAALLYNEAPRGLLLTGLPGTGKTVLADGIVDAIRRLGNRVKFYQETGTCLSPYLGETEAKLRSLFKAAEETGPSVIFLDELDGMARKRSGSASSDTFAPILATLLTLINDVKRGNVLLIAATNCPECVDDAVIRKGRFDMHIKIPLPNLEGRCAILAHYLKKKDHYLTPDILYRVGMATEGCSGSDLEALCATMHKKVISRIFPNGSWFNMSEAAIKTQRGKMRQLDLKQDIIPSLTQNLENFNTQIFMMKKEAR